MEIDLSNVPDEEAKRIQHMIIYNQTTRLRAVATGMPTSIVSLVLSSITDAGAIALAKALPRSKLELLSIRHDISDVGAIALAEALPHCKLTQLVLCGSTIGDVGAIALAEALPHSDLMELCIWGNITDVGAKALAEALPRCKLTSISFWGNMTEITDVGGLALLRAVPRSKLTTIVLYNTSISLAVRTAIIYAIRRRPYRDKLFLLLRLMVFWRFDGDNAMVHRVAEFLLG